MTSINMKLRHILPVAFAIVLSGCEKAPTTPGFEQRLHNRLSGLQVGGSLELSGASAAEVVLGGRPAAGQFIYIPFHASETSGTLQLRVSGSELGSGASMSLAPAPASSRPLNTLDNRSLPDWGMHERMHSRMTQAAAGLMANTSVRRSMNAGDRPPVRTSLSGNSAQVGQIVDINTSTTGPICQGSDMRPGRVEAISQRAIIVADTSNPSGGFTRTDYEEFAQRFDELVHPTVTEYFSEPTDIDANGRVIIFFTRAVNELTEDAEDGFIGGFFWVRDLFTRAECPASNAGEIFFLLVPDPNREASPTPHFREFVRNEALGTIGHEYQHLINAGRRIYVNGANSLETTWLDEGLSHMVEEMLFYAASGRTPRSNIAYTDLTNNVILGAINQFMVQNLLRYGRYLEEVTQQSPTNAQDGLETRGAAWAFLRYAADHSGHGDPAFFRALVNTPQTGLTNLRSVLQAEPLDAFQLWGVSNYVDDFVSGTDPRYRQLSWNFRSLLPRLAAFSDGYPLDVKALGSTPLDMGLLAATSGYIQVQGRSSATSTISITSGDAPPGQQLRLTVIRTR